MSGLLAALLLVATAADNQVEAPRSGQPDDLDGVYVAMTAVKAGCIPLYQIPDGYLSGGPFSLDTPLPAGAWLVRTGVLDDTWEQHVHPTRPRATLGFRPLPPGQGRADRDQVIACFRSVL